MDAPSKRCCTCGEQRPLTDFNRRRSAADGLQARCRACSRAWYDANRAAHLRNVRRRNDSVRTELQVLLVEYFAAHPCVDCGERDVRCLEFDHRDPTMKQANVTRMISSALNWTSVLREIEKCDVRCANCHRRITVERGGWWRQAVYERVRDERSVASHARLDRIFGG